MVSFSLPLSVYANAPEPPDYLTVVLSNLPENAVYADLLIKIDEKDPEFTDFQPNDFADSAEKAKKIVDYSADGFRSFTFHYKDSKSNIKIKRDYDNNYHHAEFCKGMGYESYYTQYEKLRSGYRDIKLVLLDKDFNIITVSKAAQLPDMRNEFVFYGAAYYDFATNSLEAEDEFNAYFLVFGGMFSMIIILISVGIEFALSLLFGFKGKQLLTIIIVNLCTQIAMRVLYIVLPFTYFIETIILEILVYITEFLIYKSRFKPFSIRKIAVYTIIANTLSLLAGIQLENYF